MDDRTHPVGRPADGTVPGGGAVPEGNPADETTRVDHPFVSPSQTPYPRGAHPEGPYGPGAEPAWAPPTDPGRPRRRRVLLMAAAALVVLVLIVAGAFVFLLPPSPDDAVAEVSGDVRGWEGVTYRGTVEQPGVGPVNVEITTNAAGDRSGTLTRPDGGRASFAEVGGVGLVNGDMAWWDPVPSGAGKAQRLSGFWVRVPAAETSWLRPAGLLPPAALADDLAGAGAPPPEYTEPGEQPVDGVQGRAIEWPGHRVVLSDERTPRLLAVVPPGSADPAGLRVTRPAPDVVGAVATGPGTLASARRYDELLYAPTDVRSALAPNQDCSTPTCTVAFTLINGGIVEARGVATVVENGKPIGRRPFTLAPGARAALNVTEPNIAYTTGKAQRVRINVLVTGG